MTGNAPVDKIEARVEEVGATLVRALLPVVGAAHGSHAAPVDFARKLKVNKVVTSRLLKALRTGDPAAALHICPGPEPLRDLVGRAARAGVDRGLIEQARSAIDSFDALIKSVGHRGSLDTILTAWLPDERRSFELRQKQAAFRAMSQLKGAMAETHFCTFIVNASADGESIDYAWIFGLLGLQRLRPGAEVRFASTQGKRPDRGARRALTLDGTTLDSITAGLVPDFCSRPIPDLEVANEGDAVYFRLVHDGYGPESAVDLTCVNMNFSARSRFQFDRVPRRDSYFANVRTPARKLHFDVLIHDELYRRAQPDLYIYDTSASGTADVNDRSRDADRYDTTEAIQPLGTGLSRFRSSDVPFYADLIAMVCARAGWRGERFRGHRCRIDFPIYGSQTVLAFSVPPRPRTQRSQ